MKDYYSILRVTQQASPETIKRSYKKLALMYHPDKNPGNIHAEEEFKLINEAYQILSDPHKKARYDLLIKYSFTNTIESTRPRNQSRRPQYSTSGERPKYSKGPGYKIDKEYYRVQKIVLAIFFVLISSVYALYEGSIYFKQVREQEEIERIALSVDSAMISFSNHNYDDSFNRLIELERSTMNSLAFSLKRDSLNAVLKEKAFIYLSSGDYLNCIDLLETVRKYDRFPSLSTLEKLSIAYSRTGQNSRAIGIYENLIERNPEDIDLYVKAASIFFAEFNLIDKAMDYLEKAKNIFITRQKSLYGEAYNLIMSTENLPPSYTEMFSLRAEINYLLSNFRDSYRDSSWVIFLSPDDPAGYLYRVQSGIKIGRTYNICSDLTKIESLGKKMDKNYRNVYCS